MDRKRNLFLGMLFLLSFVLQLLILKLYPLGTAQAEVWSKKEDEYIEVVPLKPEELKQISARQIIELPPGPDDVQPKEATYLSERAMRVEKETMAPPGQTFAGHSAPPVSSQSLFRKSDLPEEGKISLVEKIKPQPEEPSRLFNDHPGSVDFLEGAATGQITLANAYKYQYAYFFNQLKRSIQFYWNPQPALSLIPPASSDLITTIRFVLNQNGFLQELEVISSSGYQSIDRAGISAIKNATPVFSVPQGLLDQNQQLTIVCQFRIMRR